MARYYDEIKLPGRWKALSDILDDANTRNLDVWQMLKESSESPHHQLLKDIVREQSLLYYLEHRKELPMLGNKEIEHRLGFHKATIEGANATLPKHSQLRRLMRQVGLELDELLPDGRAKSVAFTELENASMWAHKAIAENAPLVPEQFEDSQKTDREAQEQKLSVEQACELMHNAYEQAAVDAGWSTQEASRKPWADVPEANKVTMRAAVSALLKSVQPR